MQKETNHVWRGALSGLGSTLIGIGLARFAYTPLIPAIIGAGWFTPGQAAYLGATNLVGYLAGAMLARPMLRFATTANLLRLMMATATASFLACASPIGFAWFSLWRFLAGISGGVLMVLAAPAVLKSTPKSKQGMVGGAIFTGVGLGIAASGTLVPLLLRRGLPQTWYGLGIISGALTAIAWSGWPPENIDSPMPVALAKKARLTTPISLLFATYALNAFGLVPHMVFLVDFVSRGLSRGLNVGALYWITYGAGACFGPILAGNLADRMGFRGAHAVALSLQAVGAVLPAISSSASALVASSLIMGAFTPGIVPIVLGRLHDLVGAESQRDMWRWATTVFAVAQAAGAYGMSFIFSFTNQYQPLFAIAAFALVAGLVLHLASGHFGVRNVAA